VTADPELVRRLVAQALAEDVGRGDVTTSGTVAADARARGELVAKQELVVAGLEVGLAAFRQLDDAVAWQPGARDGEIVARGTVLGRLEGRARALLTAERVALNFLQRLSGIATLTHRFVEAAAGTRARIRDTRKTTPLLRALEKEAVAMGGGVPHRFGLDSAVLVKDNHARLAGSVGEATRKALAAARGLEVEVEVEGLEQIEEALAAGARLILLDNFTPAEVRAAVDLVRGRARLEASGGIRLESVRAYAEAGVDFIAVGALTHSAPAADISFEVHPIRG
jgi:nicotinate-nucleotide pyrophosphorylase (carboxylating)